MQSKDYATLIWNLQLISLFIHFDLFTEKKKPRDGMVMSSCLPKLKLFRAKIKQDDSGKKMFEKCVRSQNII